MRFLLQAVLLVLVLLAMMLPSSCEHSALDLDDLMPIDTMTIDTMTIDTTVTLDPCDPDIVYFDLQVLPLLRSNCAFSGCHDAASAQDGVILESYESVIETADVEPFNLNDSEIYEVLVDTDEDERMPPPPTSRLTADQIQIIARWILQGAEQLECDPSAVACDTIDVSYATQVAPVIETFCKGCHSGAAPSGGIDLSNHSGVQTVALSGRLSGAINWQNGFSNMPQGGQQLAECTIDQFQSWIDQGAPNN